MKLLMYSASKMGSSSRLRLYQFVDCFEKIGINVTIRNPFPERPWRSNIRNALLQRFHDISGSIVRIISRLFQIADAFRFDAVLMHRDIVPNTKVIFLERLLFKLNRHVIFDYDDLICIGNRKMKFDIMVKNAFMVVAGNDNLASYALKESPNVIVIPTVVDTERYRPAVKINDRLSIGWSGIKETLECYLPIVKDVILHLSERYDFDFVVISDSFLQEKWDGVKMINIPWRLETEIEDLQKIDIGIMPLANNEFEKGKCGGKLLLYGAIGIPSVCSPVGVNKDIVVHGRTGYHALDNAQWIEYLETLIKNKALRENMGRNARRHIEEKYSVNAVMPLYKEILIRAG